MLTRITKPGSTLALSSKPVTMMFRLHSCQETFGDLLERWTPDPRVEATLETFITQKVLFRSVFLKFVINVPDSDQSGRLFYPTFFRA
jgi:hypothetical protein